MSSLEDLEVRVQRIEKNLWPSVNVTPPLPSKPRMGVGINVDPNHGEAVSATRVEALGVKYARFPVWADVNKDRNLSYQVYAQYAASLLSKNIEPVIVFDSRSWANNNYPRWGSMPIHFFQMGNEPDLVSDSSSTQSKQAFTNDLFWAREWLDTWRPTGLPKRYIIAGGLASGNPDWLKGVDLSPVDAIAVHPYGQRADGLPQAGWGFGEMRELLKRYQAVTDKPLWVTEFGAKHSEIKDHPMRGVYIQRALDLMEELGVVVGIPYCMATAMHPEYELETGAEHTLLVNAAKMRA